MPGQALTRWLRASAVLALVLCACASSVQAAVVQEAYLKAIQTSGDRLLGSSMGMSGDTLVVGAPTSSQGAAVFVRSGGTWTQQAWLESPNPFDDPAGDGFGGSVAVSGDIIVVGAPAADNGITYSGAAFVFVRSGETWTLQADLTAQVRAASARFGRSVAVAGETIVIGAPYDDPGTGSVYVFERTDGTWSQQAHLRASNQDNDDLFGWSVAIDGDTLVAGAIHEDSSSDGVNGDQADNSAKSAGAAYVFVRSGATWSQQAYIKASNSDGQQIGLFSGDLFGSAVAISAETIVVSAVAEQSATTGINGDQADNSATGAGAAYVFVRNGATWAQQAYVKASNTDAIDQFGMSVAILGDSMVVGAAFEDSAATGVDGDQASNDASFAGAAYTFARSSGTWVQRAYLKASNTEAGDEFGSSVAVAGTTVVVGARYEDGGATSINGDQEPNGWGRSGAAYAFDSAAPPYLMVRNGTRFVTQSFALEGVSVTLARPGQSILASPTNSQGVAFIEDTAFDPTLAYDVSLSRSPDLRSYQTVSLSGSPVTLVLPRTARESLDSKLQTLETTSPLVTGYDATLARDLAAEWNTLEPELASSHADRDLAVARLIVSAEGMVDVYRHTEPLANETSKVFVNIVTSLVAIRKVADDLVGNEVQSNLGWRLLLWGIEVGLRQIQTTVIDAIRNALPDPAVEAFDAIVSVTTKTLLEGFRTPEWNTPTARKALLEGLSASIAAQAGAILFSSEHVASTQALLDQAAARARDLQGTGTIQEAYVASQDWAMLVAARNDNLVASSALIQDTAEGWAFVGDFFLIAGELPTAQFLLGAGVAIKLMCSGGLVAAGVVDMDALTKTTFVDTPVVTGRAFDPGLVPSAVDGNSTANGAKVMSELTAGYLSSLNAVRERIAASDRIGALEAAEDLLDQSAIMDAAIEIKLLQIQAVASGSGIATLESSSFASLAAAGSLGAERGRLYTTLAGYASPELAVPDATDAQLLTQMDVVAQAIGEFDTAAANADFAASGLTSPAFVTVAIHGLNVDSGFGRTAPGAIELRARVMNSGAMDSQGLSVAFAMESEAGLVPVVELTSLSTQAVGTLAPGEVRELVWTANATDTTPDGSGSSVTYRVVVAATSGRTRGAVGGFEVLSALDRIYADGFELLEPKQSRDQASIAQQRGVDGRHSRARRTL